MAILSKIESRTWRGRMIHGGILLALCLGAVTMVYPFLIMASGSLRSEMDGTDLDVVPAYLVDQNVLWRKFLETKYNQDVVRANRAHVRQSFDFPSFEVPQWRSHRPADDLRQFLHETPMPRHWHVLGGAAGIRTTPELLRQIRSRLAEHFDDDIMAFNQEIGAPVPGWNTVVIATPDWENPRYDYQNNTLHEIYFSMQDDSPWPQRQLVSITGYFLQEMVYPTFGQLDTTRYNEVHERPVESFHDFVLPRVVPGEDEPNLRARWIEFVREELNPAFIILNDTDDERYREFLQEKYPSIRELNLNWGTSIDRFDQIELPRGQLTRGAPRQDYQEFLREQAPEHYRLIGPEYSWRDWLRERYRSIDDLNAAYGTEYASFDEVHVPMDLLEYQYAGENSRSLRWVYATRNFINVFDEIFLRGRAFINTVIFCTLAVVTALLVNPMAAYAMSRFQLPGTYKFLLLMMATISFPPMVTTIPQFIMMRELNMLNTFAALVLPGIANGYLIFLLKGFFDSLPRELYEAATIDGASELRIFFQITMSLSKPILAVVGLSAFNAAYGTFLYALIVAPRQDMWVLNVWLYQYRELASSGGVFASVMIASVPTLLVFLFAQKIIIRGIVVPVEK